MRQLRVDTGFQHGGAVDALRHGAGHPRHGLALRVDTRVRVRIAAGLVELKVAVRAEETVDGLVHVGEVYRRRHANAFVEILRVDFVL